MPAAVAIPLALGASAGSSLIGAKMASSGAKKAAKTQSASADKAMAMQYQLAQQQLALQQAQYQNASQLYSPYVSAAPQSLAALHQYLGLAGPQQGGGPPMGGGQMGGKPMGFPDALSRGGGAFTNGPMYGQPGGPPPGGGPPPIPMQGGMMKPGVDPRMFAGRTTRVPLGQIQARASGGPVTRGNPYLVGEQGPELFTPSRSGRISSAERTDKMGYGSTYGGGMYKPAPGVGGGALGPMENPYLKGQTPTRGPSLPGIGGGPIGPYPYTPDVPPRMIGPLPTRGPSLPGVGGGPIGPYLPPGVSMPLPPEAMPILTTPGYPQPGGGVGGGPLGPMAPPWLPLPTGGRPISEPLPPEYYPAQGPKLQFGGRGTGPLPEYTTNLDRQRSLAALYQRAGRG